MKWTLDAEDMQNQIKMLDEIKQFWVDHTEDRDERHELVYYFDNERIVHELIQIYYKNMKGMLDDFEQIDRDWQQGMI